MKEIHTKYSPNTTYQMQNKITLVHKSLQRDNAIRQLFRKLHSQLFKTIIHV